MLIRAAQPSDADAVARVHVRAWQVGYRGLLPDAYLDGLRPEDRARRYTFEGRDPSAPQTLVALEGDTLLGFATISTAPKTDLAGVAELSALHVNPDAWGRGVGTALIDAARARLVSLGFTEAFLWLLADNVRAERFYRRDGWAPDGTRRSDVVWGIQVDEIRFRRALP